MENSKKTPVAKHYDEIIKSYPKKLIRLFEDIICGIIKIDNEGCLIFDSLDESFLEYLEKKEKNIN